MQKIFRKKEIVPKNLIFKKSIFFRKVCKPTGIFFLPLADFSVCSLLEVSRMFSDFHQIVLLGKKIVSFENNKNHAKRFLANYGKFL